MESGQTFHDPGLKGALVREVERIDVDPDLRARVEALFDQPAGAIAATAQSANMPQRRIGWLLAAAAVVVVGLSVAILTLNRQEEDEYLIAEARLWPAMASLYRPSPTTGPAVALEGAHPVLSDPRYTLVAVRNDRIETVPCQVSDYRRDDGVQISIIITPAANLLREPEEETDERYDERVGEIRIAGGIKNDFWVCVAAPANAPQEVFTKVLDAVTIASP